jgi:hypothetical protein
VDQAVHFFHGKRHPQEMGEAEVQAFLTHLAADRLVAASTQNQALGALLFMYQKVLGRELDFMAGFDRAQRRKRVPVVVDRRGHLDRPGPGFDQFQQFRRGKILDALRRRIPRRLEPARGGPAATGLQPGCSAGAVGLPRDKGKGPRLKITSSTFSVE